MPRRTILLSAVLAAALVAAPAESQTPEQTYRDWARLDFRPQEYAFRRSSLIARLRDEGGGILLVPSSDGTTDGDTFRQSEDFWYLTGLEVPESVLVLDIERDRSMLFLPARDYRFDNPGRPNDFPGRPLGDDPQLRGTAGTEDLYSLDELDGFLQSRLAGGTVLQVNAGRPGPIEEPELPRFGTLSAEEITILRLQRTYPQAPLRNAFESIARGRMVKSPSEVRRMRIAAEATAEAIVDASHHIADGVTEREIQGHFESSCRTLGSQSIPFTPIVKSGPNSLWPWRILAAHYDRRDRVMEDGDLVILDVGCEIDGYISDVGRTFPVNGRFTDVQREKLLLSTSVADAIIAAIRPGTTFRELTAVAYEAIPDHEAGYMQTPSFFGHHIGMKAGDPALIDEPLRPGMVFTVEPWYYNHDLEVSVFVEDVVLVTEDGAEVLTAGLARTPEALERIMRGAGR